MISAAPDRIDHVASVTRNGCRRSTEIRSAVDGAGRRRRSHDRDAPERGRDRVRRRSASRRSLCPRPIMPPIERSMPPRRSTIVCPVAASSSVIAAAASRLSSSRVKTPRCSDAVDREQQRRASAQATRNGARSTSRADRAAPGRTLAPPRARSAAAVVTQPPGRPWRPAGCAASLIASPAERRRDAPVAQHHHAVGDVDELGQGRSNRTGSRSPCAARSRISWKISPLVPTSTPRVGS